MQLNNTSTKGTCSPFSKCIAPKNLPVYIIIMNTQNTNSIQISKYSFSHIAFSSNKSLFLDFAYLMAFKIPKIMITSVMLKKLNERPPMIIMRWVIKLYDVFVDSLISKVTPTIDLSHNLRIQLTKRIILNMLRFYPYWSISFHKSQYID